MITAGFTAFLLLLMFLWKWQLPVIDKIVDDPGIEVQLNLPEEPVKMASGGGGGGNPVQAIGKPGIAEHVPPAPGTKEDSKDIDDDKDKTSPAILKPDNPKKTAVKINENRSITKVEPKPIVETPAPPRPKAVVGRTLTGTGKGGGATDDFERSGGSGNGNGVGIGSGTGGGKGNGDGGGNGPGSGPGSGPKVTNGDRKIVRYYSFQGDLNKAVVYANINVSPEGVGSFVSVARGSSTSTQAYKDAIIQYLTNIEI